MIAGRGGNSGRREKRGQTFPNEEGRPVASGRRGLSQKAEYRGRGGNKKKEGAIQTKGPHQRHELTNMKRIDSQRLNYQERPRRKKGRQDKALNPAGC